MSAIRLLRAVSNKIIGNSEVITGSDIGYLNKRGLDVVAQDSISKAHVKVHEGNFYQAGYFFNDVANGNSAEILITVGANQNPHAIISAAVGGECVGYLFEGPTITNNGTAITSVNSNRESTNTSEVSLYHTPTTTADGTQLSQALIPGGTGGRAVGGSASTETRSGAEIILKLNTSYLVRVTNQSGQAQDLSITVTYYEAPGQ